MPNYRNAGHGPRTLPSHCTHPNTAAAPGLEYASVWCPDCKQWVVLHERPAKTAKLQEQNDV